MKALILYSSSYGNTQQVAKALAKAAGPDDAIRMAHPSEVSTQALDLADLIVVGSPTQGGRPTPEVQKFLDNLRPGSLKNKIVAAFDTRFAIREHGLGLRLVMKTVGFAAPRIATTLQSKGGKLAADPEGFIVSDKPGPLKQGELTRAEEWMRKILETHSVPAHAA